MRVLLAEDEKRMAAALVALLKQEKYDVDHMADGASAGAFWAYFHIRETSFACRGKRGFLLLS